MYNKNWFHPTLKSFAYAAALTSTGALATPVIPDTDDTTWRYQSPPQPGWSNINGSCDTSSVTIYGLEASVGAFGDPALAGYIDPPGAIPNAGHTHFLSCGTWVENAGDGEGAQAAITGLTIGEIYQVDFFVAGFRPIAEAPDRDYEVGNSYRITIGDESSGYVTYNSKTWIPQTYTFTADNAVELLQLNVANTTRRSVTHFSIASDAIAIAVLDTDQDGLTDAQEIAAGSDVNNPDTDGDGLLDVDEVNTHGTDPSLADTDSDGLDDNAELTTHATNPQVPDTDSDGLPDGAEVNTHSTDPTSEDTDSDGLHDADEVNTHLTDPTNRDTDGDTLTDGAEVDIHETNPLEVDTDTDGLTDYDEINVHNTDPNNADTDGGSVNDGDEITNGTDPLSNNRDDTSALDTDGDGIADDAETALGTDPANPDTDGDGLNDGLEVNTHNTDPTLADTDGDGLNDGDEITIHSTDPLNVDSDGSGVADGEEVINGSDPLTGPDDAVDLDTDNDGIPNGIEGNADQDGDTIPNALDLDSDNDGIADIIEAGGTDTDNDGQVDNQTDDNNDGLDDSVAAVPYLIEDQDNDGLANYLDLDSDQDGLPDLFEAGGTTTTENGTVDDTTDANGDGWSDAFAATPLPLTDTDSDGTPDYLDTDSDNDDIFDLVEAGGVDVDENGLIDAFLDSDADGIPDLADIDITEGEDTDEDGIDDLFDASITLGDDVNQNGVDDSLEADADGNGLALVPFDTATLPDANGNGNPDVYETDNGGAPNGVLNDGPVLITGVNGGFGCSIFDNGSSKFDPLLVLLAIASFGVLNRRRLELLLKHSRK